MGKTDRACLRRALMLGASMAGAPIAAQAQTANPLDNYRLPSGQFSTPQFIPGVVTLPLNPHLANYPNFVAGQAMTNAVSPDGNTLLVLTSGYNTIDVPSTGALDANASSEFIFVYDITGHTPVQKQVLQIPTANAGIAFAPDGQSFYVGSGGGDSVYSYALSKGGWAQTGTPIKLGHAAGVGVGQGPSTAGLAVSADGSKIAVANEFNDSVSLINVATGEVSGELDLRPGIENAADTGVAGGETPFWITLHGNTAYVSSARDREVDVLDISGTTPAMIGRIAVKGTPVKMLLDASGSRLFVAADNDDSVQVISTATNQVVARIPVAAPFNLLTQAPRYRGAAPNALSLSADGNTLYVSDAGENAVAVVNVTPGQAYATTALIPTGWYPNAVSVVNGWLYASNSKSDGGANPGRCNTSYKSDTGASYVGTCQQNQYVLQIDGASLQASPIPTGPVLGLLTLQVGLNDGFVGVPNPLDYATMTALHRRIKHVIYIIKENRTYDQLLGDLGRGNGDPSIVEFGQAVTPNFHALATSFVDLDNFEDSSEVSGNGWQWDLQGRETDFNVKTIPLEYSARRTNAPYDSEAEVRNVPVGVGSVANRQVVSPTYPNDPNLLPGTNSDDVADGPDDDDTPQTQTGLLWDAALKAGLTVRTYGVNTVNIGTSSDPNAFANNDVQSHAVSPALINNSDNYFRGFDQTQPDYYRFTEWQREFQQFEQSGQLPSLEIVRLSHDHMGSFATAAGGVNTPELQQADDDYSVGSLVQDVANSPYKSNTLVFVIEDDAQDGPDHVDAHRSTSYVVGPYVKQGQVVDERYTTVSMLRTIEDVLGIGHLSLYDANQRPMTEVFDLAQQNWNFTATPSQYLYSTTLPLPVRSADAGPAPMSTHGASWWAAQTKGYNWSHEDRVPTMAFNELLWRGLMGGKPYPTERSGRDLTPVRKVAARPGEATLVR